ncbi:MAG: rod shape-determining protein MreC [Acidimicrobiales bacterium]
MLSRGPGQSRFTLAVLVVISITILAVDLLGIGPIGLVRSGVSGVLSPVRAVGDVVFGRDDSAEVERLRNRIAELEGVEARAANAEAELRRLQEQLGLTPPEGVEVVAANVISEAVSNFDRTIEIDKGADAGIEVDMPVQTEAGLVGVVDSVTFTSARIRLITDTTVNVGVRHAESGDVGIAHGQGEGKPLFIESAFGAGTEVADDDVFVTAGPDGSNFPPGVPVGRAVQVRGAANPLEQEVFIDPYADLDRLTQVGVLLFTPSVAGSGENG